MGDGKVRIFLHTPQCLTRLDFCSCRDEQVICSLQLAARLYAVRSSGAAWDVSPHSFARALVHHTRVAARKIVELTESVHGKLCVRSPRCKCESMSLATGRRRSAGTRACTGHWAAIKRMSWV